MKRTFLFAWLLTTTSFPVRADVRVLRHVRIVGASGACLADVREVEHTRGMMRRIEIVYDSTGMTGKRDSVSAVTIIRLDKSAQWTMWPAAKRWREDSLRTVWRSTWERCRRRDSSCGESRQETGEQTEGRYSSRRVNLRLDCGLQAIELRTGFYRVFGLVSRFRPMQERGSLRFECLMADSLVAGCRDLLAFDSSCARLLRVNAAGQYAIAVGAPWRFLNLDLSYCAPVAPSRTGLGSLGSFPIRSVITYEVPRDLCDAEGNAALLPPWGMDTTFAASDGSERQARDDRAYPSEPDHCALLKITDEILEFSIEQQPPDAFEIPAGWSKD